MLIKIGRHTDHTVLHLVPSIYSPRWRGQTYPEVGQLQGDLDEGVRAGAALLDQALPKVTEGDDVRVHVLSQCLGHGQRALDHLLTLGHT